MDYTPAVHTIDRKWIDLAAGYQAIQLFNTKLTAEFGRAVRVGHKQQFRKELTEWQKKRRIFFSLVGIALLSIVGLCLTAVYFRDVACVIIYWAVLVLIILVTLAVAGRQYINEMVSGKPVPHPAEGLVIDLEGRWWGSLSLQEMEFNKSDKKNGADYMGQLAHSIPDSYTTYFHLDHDVILVGPSGIWILFVETWDGMITKQDGSWKQIQTMRDKLGRKRHEEKMLELSPDDQWVQLEQEKIKSLEEQLPGLAWTRSLIQGGMAFSHPKVILDKKGIQGNTASYGPLKAWAERIHRAPAVDGFTIDMQLEILETLTGDDNAHTVSAKEEAEQLYQQAVDELRAYVANLVK